VNNDEAVRPDGKKGPGLFAYLRGLQDANGGDRRDVIAMVFKGTINRMINGYLLRDVINKVKDIHFTSSDEIHTLGHLYESMLTEMRDAAGDSGEFYTPRAVRSVGSWATLDYAKIRNAPNKYWTSYRAGR
jgi:type I restriction enzyme M protein